MSISQEVAPYFKRRKLIANQVIEKKLDRASVALTTCMSDLQRNARTE